MSSSADDTDRGTDSDPSRLSKPDGITQQTEFADSGVESEDSPVAPKDDPVETGLDDFGMDMPDRRQNKETRVEHPDCSLFADRRNIASGDEGEQETLVHPVKDDQQTLDGGNAREITDVVKVAQGGDSEESTES